ncbi:MAG: hypothetical protein V4508_15700 [Pseudomonadota bacterium]
MSPPAPVTNVLVSGIAAVGDPLTGATVRARCTGASSVPDATTSATGAWSFVITPNGLPCALQVSGGSASGAANTQVLHSFAAAAGVTNITPLTDLLVGVAAGRTPATWFAELDGTHPPALAAAIALAAPRVLLALKTAGYTVPAGPFDPLTTAFTATSADSYDALLDAFAAGLVANNISYPTMLANVLGAAPGGVSISLPTFGVNLPGTVPATPIGPIGLLAKANAQAADIAPLVGRFSGSFSTVTEKGKTAQVTGKCSIDVKADGTMSLTAGEKTVMARMNGDVGNLIISVNNGRAVQTLAFDFSTSSKVTVMLASGYVVSATAGDANVDLSCTVPNPHITTAGSVTRQVENGATASDVAASMVGTYRNATCMASLSSAGTIHLVSGSVDVQGTLGGDQDDSVFRLDTIHVTTLTAIDSAADGGQTRLEFSLNDADPGLGLPSNVTATATTIVPRPFKSLASCLNLIKQ